jgi:hypothetical protein
MQAAIVAGPALGGFLYAAGAPVVYGLCAALFVAGISLLVSLRLQRPAAARAPVTMDALFAGFAFIWRRKAVLGAISLDLAAVLLGGATALLPIFAKDILHTGPWGVGLLRAAPAAGALVMSVALVRWPISLPQSTEASLPAPDRAGSILGRCSTTPGPSAGRRFAR